MLVDDTMIRPRSLRGRDEGRYAPESVLDCQFDYFADEMSSLDGRGTEGTRNTGGCLTNCVIVQWINVKVRVYRAHTQQITDWKCRVEY